MADAKTEQPEAKKPKMSNPIAPDSEWPEAWMMTDDVKDQKAENRQVSAIRFEKRVR